MKSFPLLKSLSICLLVALFGSSCITVGPNFQSPSAALEDGWLEYEDPRLETGPPVLPEWWKTAFHDPVLDKLIDEALEENLTLRSAGLRVLQSRQQLAIAVGSLFPQQQALSGETGFEREGPAKFDVYDLGFNLSWEIDVWGSFRRQIETASAALDASVADYDGVMISLISQVAQTYLLIRTTEQRLVFARNNLDYQQESVRIASEKLNAGDTSPLDFNQAETLFYATKSSVSGLEQSLQQLKISLAILLGKPPHDMSKLLGKPRPVPTVAPEIAVGMPQDLIRRRPDIRVAERQLAAQSAQIGVAISELYPQFGIDGLIGTSVATGSGLNFSDLFKSDSFDYTLTGFFDWNLFNYGRLQNNVRLQDAAFQQLLEDYRETVIEAQGEVENAIIAFFKSQEQLESLKLAADAAQRAADVSAAQYEGGQVGYNTVDNTLRALVSQQDQLASIQGTVATNLVEIYTALGGGWELRKGRSPIKMIPETTKGEMKERGKYWKKTLEED